MNKAILMGRLTRDPDIRYTNGEKPVCVARYTLAVDRRFKRDGEQQADFIPCIAFGRQGEFAQKYFQKGTKIVISGRIQTGSYTNRDGVKVYTTDVIVEEQDFAESKAAAGKPKEEPAAQGQPTEPTAKDQPPVNNDGFMTIPEGIEEELPFI